MNKFYKISGAWWQSSGYGDKHYISNITGPFCSECYVELEFPDYAYDENGHFDVDWLGVAECLKCKKKHEFKEDQSSIKKNIVMILRSNYRATLDKISLEEPLAQVKVRDEDDTYFLSAKIGQKDGKKIGVVYFGEKNKTQNKKDYSQIFIDLEDEQVRFDKANKHPKDITAVFTVEFAETKIEVRKKKK